MGQIGAVPPDHRDVPLGLRFDEQGSAYRRMASLFGDHPRKEGDTQAGCDELYDELNLATSRRDGRLEASPSAGVKDNPVQAKPVSNRMKG